MLESAILHFTARTFPSGTVLFDVFHRAALRAASPFGADYELGTDIPCKSLLGFDGSRAPPAVPRSLGRFECGRRVRSIPTRERDAGSVRTTRIVSGSLRSSTFPYVQVTGHRPANGLLLGDFCFRSFFRGSLFCVKIPVYNLGHVIISVMKGRCIILDLIKQRNVYYIDFSVFNI